MATLNPKRSWRRPSGVREAVLRGSTLPDHSALSLPWCTVTVAFAARFVGSDFGHMTFTVFSPCAGTSALSGSCYAKLPMTSEPVTGAALLPMFAIVAWMTHTYSGRVPRSPARDVELGENRRLDVDADAQAVAASVRRARGPSAPGRGVGRADPGVSNGRITAAHVAACGFRRHRHADGRVDRHAGLGTPPLCRRGPTPGSRRYPSLGTRRRAGRDAAIRVQHRIERAESRCRRRWVGAGVGPR